MTRININIPFNYPKILLKPKLFNLFDQIKLRISKLNFNMNLFGL